MFCVRFIIILMGFQRGRLGVPCFIYCLSARAIDWRLFATLLHYTPPKVTSIASAICNIWKFILIDWYIGRPSQASSCLFDGLSYSSHFYLQRHVHSQWLGDSWLWAWTHSPIVFIFISVEGPCSNRRPIVPKFLSIKTVIMWVFKMYSGIGRAKIAPPCSTHSYKNTIYYL